MAKDKKQKGGRPGGGSMMGGNLQATLMRAQQLRDEMEAVQAEMAVTEASGESGGGKVRATVNGAGTITALVIDPAVIDPSEPDLLSDLVLSAVGAATDAMSLITQERMGPYAAMLPGRLTTA